MWFARTDGLARFADGQFTLLSRQAGFPLSLTAIAEDEERNLWVGSTLGIARVARAEIDKAIAGHSSHAQYTLFDRSDGIAGTPQSFYSLGRPVARAGDGRLWFVTGSGMTVIDPKALGTVGPPSPVRVERVVANDTARLPAPGLRLPPRTSRLQFDYTVVNLTSPLRTHFRYRLEGFDADWIDAGTRRQAYYTNLPPGAYRFLVVASNSEGTPLSETAWEFSIEPMFYQTAGSRRRSSAGRAGRMGRAGACGCGRSAVNSRCCCSERNRLSREIHDTLLQSLVGVALQFDALAGDLRHRRRRTREQLVRMRKQVEEHIREARQSIWNLRSPTLRAPRSRRRAARVRRSRRPATAGDGGRRWTSRARRRRGYRASRNSCCASARKRSPTPCATPARSRITSASTTARSDIVLSVADDGRGFDFGARRQSEPNGHYGLITMKERAAEIGGTLRHRAARAGRHRRSGRSCRSRRRVEERIDVGA